MALRTRFLFLFFFNSFFLSTALYAPELEVEERSSSQTIPVSLRSLPPSEQNEVSPASSALLASSLLESPLDEESENYLRWSARQSLLHLYWIKREEAGLQQREAQGSQATILGKWRTIYTTYVSYICTFPENVISIKRIIKYVEGAVGEVSRRFGINVNVLLPLRDVIYRNCIERRIERGETLAYLFKLQGMRRGKFGYSQDVEAVRAIIEQAERDVHSLPGSSVANSPSLSTVEPPKPPLTPDANGASAQSSSPLTPAATLTRSVTSNAGSLGSSTSSLSSFSSAGSPRAELEANRTPVQSPDPLPAASASTHLIVLTGGSLGASTSSLSPSPAVSSGTGLGAEEEESNNLAFLLQPVENQQRSAMSTLWSSPVARGVRTCVNLVRDGVYVGMREIVRRLPS